MIHTPAATHLSARDLMARWRVSRAHVYRLIARGTIASIRIGGSVRVPLTDVERYEREHTAPARDGAA